MKRIHPPSLMEIEKIKSMVGIMAVPVGLDNQHPAAEPLTLDQKINSGFAKMVSIDSWSTASSVLQRLLPDASLKDSVSPVCFFINLFFFFLAFYLFILFFDVFFFCSMHYLCVIRKKMEI